jgi:tellurite resistance protein TerC
MQMFHFIHYGLSAVLVFVGVKMLISDIYKIPVGFSLGVVAAIIATSIAASMVWPKKANESEILPKWKDTA